MGEPRGGGPTRLWRADRGPGTPSAARTEELDEVKVKGALGPAEADLIEASAPAGRAASRPGDRRAAVVAATVVSRLEATRRLG